MSNGQVRASARDAVVDFKKSLLRDAAKEVLARKGIRDTSVREIAAAAGYTTSAIYTHYGSVEELHGDIVREAMQGMLEELRAVTSGKAGRKGYVVTCMSLWLDYYIERPREFELSFHLYDGIRPHGLGDKLNAELNTLMKGVFAELANAFAADDPALTREQCQIKATAGATYIFGILLMYHTRRLRLLNHEPHRLLEEYLERVERPATR